MKARDIRWGAALGGALGSEVVMIVAAFAWVAIYSYLIHPGESAAFYQTYAIRASPWVAVVVGVPVFYLACRWIGARSPSRAWPTAMAIFGIYLALDLPLTLSGGGENPTLTPGFLAANYLLKLLACHLGGRGAARRELPQAA